MDCYGRYDAFKTRCSSCELAVYCKDAKDPTPLSYVEHDTVEEIIGDDRDRASRPENISLLEELVYSLEDQREALGHCRLFAKLLRVVERHPNTWAAARWKIMHPEWSYADIARKMGCDKQLVAYHLDRAKEVMPEITHGLLIDHRYHPELKSRKVCLKSLTGVPSLKMEISWRQLAKKSGIPVTTVRRFVSGERMPSRPIAERLGIILNVNPRDVWPAAFDECAS